MSYNDDDEYDDFDEDGGSEEYYAQLGDKVNFGLFEMHGGAAQVHGKLKQFETKDGHLVYYKDDPTGYTISVERLLQADGYTDSTEKQRLTLFVLKLVLACNSSSRIKQAVFNMSFEDIPQKGKKKAYADKKVKPVIQAWAPFGKMSKTEPVDVDIEKTKRADVEFGGGGGGVTGKGSAGVESKIKWTERYWESAHSYPTFGEDQTRTGVRWVLNANEKTTHGLPPNMMVGILLSRQSDEPYLVNFDMKVTGGLLQELLRGIEKILGRKPGVTKPYRVMPSKEAIALHTGLNMLPKVKLKDMLGLKGKGENLILVWDDEETDSAEKKDAEKKEGKAATEQEELAPSITN